MSPGSLRRRLLEASNLFAPVVDEVIALWVLAVIPHASLAERELVLRVHERRRCTAPDATDTARTKDAVANDLLVFVMAHRVPDLPCQLVTDDAPLPHATAPQCKTGYQQERQEYHELDQTTAQECAQKPYICDRLRPVWRLSRS